MAKLLSTRKELFLFAPVETTWDVLAAISLSIIAFGRFLDP